MHTLTADNGKAFAGHQAFSEDLSAGFFFATPYHSRDRGLNEHTNGLVRQYFDKTTDFCTVEASAVHDVEYQLKTRPPGSGLPDAGGRVRRRASGYRNIADTVSAAGPAYSCVMTG